MRASRQPGSARNAASTSPITGAMAMAGRSRSFDCVSRNSNTASRLVSVATASIAAGRAARAGGVPLREHRLGRHGDAGIDQHGRQWRQSERSRQHFADAAHDARARIEAHRHVGAGRARGLVETRIVAREGRLRAPTAATPRRRRPSRRRARPRPAASCPAETRRGRGLGTARQGAGRLEHEIVGAVAGLRRARPAHRQRSSPPGDKAQAIAEIGEHDQAFELVIAVGAAAEDPQRQIDLSRRNSRQRNRQGQGSTAVADFLRLGRRRPPRTYLRAARI